jgi:O-antigen biosynthesis protein
MSEKNGSHAARMNVAVIFDGVTRPETTGVYCRRALAQLARATHFHPDMLGEVPRRGFDLYLGIDDGQDYDWPADLRPAAWWAIDTHIDFDRALRRARQADYVFAAQRDGAESLRRAGIEQAQWLPLACDSELHSPQDVAKQYDIAFVGNLLPGPRTNLVRLIQQQFRNSFVGNAYFADMARVYSASRVVFNRSVKNDVNMRVFEALACGSLLVTNDLSDNGQAELFRDGIHLVTYRDGDELIDKLRYYLRKPDLCERIARAGRTEVLAKHTYAHRMRDLLAAAPPTRRVSEAMEVRRVSEAREARRVSEARVARSVSEDASVSPLTDGTASTAMHATPHSDPSYFDFPRPELLALVPDTARRVLEVGCGAGRLGESIKRRQSCHVTGIERDPAAAERARERLDRVIVADAEEDRSTDGSVDNALDFPPDSFDCLILGDVLEHFVDPERFLRRARAWLTDGAAVVASIPNVRHHSVVASLLSGNWTYEPAGLLDNTHLRFFTRRAIEALFARTGYRIARLGMVPGPGYDEWQQQGSPVKLRLGAQAFDAKTRDEAEEFFVYQYLVTAGIVGSSQPAVGSELREESAPPKCLLLMVTYNRLEYTRQALEAVLKLDYPNVQLVVWDNASTDGTLDYLRQRLSGIEHARLIASPTNRGVVWPMNEVWRSDPSAALLAKIDNDTLVPPDLLTRLAECHARHDRFGVLSGFHFRQEGEALAEDFRVKSFGDVRILPQPYVGGCAVMVRRRTLDELGPIDCQPRAASAPFMDSGWTAYQQRMTAAGYINGYPWPPIHVEHMEDTRSAYCIRSPEHQQYKQALRGMDLEQFTEALCVWRPNWEKDEG